MYFKTLAKKRTLSRLRQPKIGCFVNVNSTKQNTLSSVILRYAKFVRVKVVIF